MGFDPSTVMLAAGGFKAGTAIIGGMAQNNAAKDQATNAIADANEKAGFEEQGATRFAAKQAVGYTASGVDLTGSPLLVMQDTLNAGRNNAQNTLNSGYAQANTLQQRGRNALTAGIFGGIGDVGDAYSKYKQFQLANGKPAGSGAAASNPYAGMSDGSAMGDYGYDTGYGVG